MDRQSTKQNAITSSDEIDLIGLVKVLWDKKYWIALSTIIFTAIAGLYAFTAKEQWTSNAEIIAPRSVDLNNYLVLRKEYARILDQEFDQDAFMSSLYSKFERLSYSLDLREAFLSNSEVYKKLIEDKNEEQARKILNELAREKISITKPDHKKDPNAIGTKYTFTAQTPELAQDTLKEFINYVNLEAFKLDLKEFGVISNEKLADLKFEYEKIQQDLIFQRKVKLENLSKALEIAEKAGVKEYSRALNDNSNNVTIASLAMSDTKIPLSDSKLSDSNYLFMLGEKYLKAQIEIIKDKRIVYPPRFYQIEEQVKKLEGLFLKAKDIKANTYRYLSSPDYPVKRDWPKRLLFIVVGAFLGGIFGCILVFSRKFLKLRIK